MCLVNSLTLVPPSTRLNFLSLFYLWGFAGCSPVKVFHYVLNNISSARATGFFNIGAGNMLQFTQILVSTSRQKSMITLFSFSSFPAHKMTFMKCSKYSAALSMIDYGQDLLCIINLDILHYRRASISCQSLLVSRESLVAWSSIRESLCRNIQEASLACEASPWSRPQRSFLFFRWSPSSWGDQSWLNSAEIEERIHVCLHRKELASWWRPELGLAGAKGDVLPHPWRCCTPRTGSSRIMSREQVGGSRSCCCGCWRGGAGSCSVASGRYQSECWGENSSSPPSPRECSAAGLSRRGCNSVVVRPPGAAVAADSLPPPSPSGESSAAFNFDGFLLARKPQPIPLRRRRSRQFSIGRLRRAVLIP